MSQQNGEDKQDHAPPSSQSSVVVQLVISFDLATHNISVAGIPPDKVMALGMLEFAKQIVLSAGQGKPPASRIVQAPPGMRLT